MRCSFSWQDLSKLNRDPNKIIYLSAHARENSLQPENGAIIKPYKYEMDDTALVDFIPFLECKSAIFICFLAPVALVLFLFIMFVLNQLKFLRNALPPACAWFMCSCRP